MPLRRPVHVGCVIGLFACVPAVALSQGLHACGGRGTGAEPADAPAPLRALAEAVTSDSVDALTARFWRDVVARGTPLVEALSGDARCVRVTFLYRDATAASVALVGAFSGWLDSLSRLERLGTSDIWYRTLAMPSDSRVGYQFRVVSSHDSNPPSTGSRSLPGRVVLDPTNARVDSAFGTTRSMALGPNASGAKWTEPRAHLARGRVEKVQLSADGDTVKTAWVYLPPGYDGTGSFPLLVMFDGGAYVSPIWVNTPAILDNLIADRRITPVIALFLPQEPTPAARQATMGNDARYGRFVAEEAIPFVQRRYAATRDPTHVVIGGSSLGGLAASYVAFHYPSVVRNVLSQSGSYQWPGPDDPEPEWLTRRIAAAPILPLRFYAEVGLFEVGPAGFRGLNLVVVNRHFRDVLRARGYALTYREVGGAHEYLSWRGTLAEALPLFFPDR